MTKSKPLIPSSNPLAQSFGSLALSGVVVLLAVLASIFLSGVILRIGVTPDFPWLLASGDWILQHRQLPATDLFSWTAADRPWLLYQWGFEAALAGINRVAGHAGVGIVFAWAVLAVYLLVPIATSSHRMPIMLVALIGAPVLAVLTVNMSIRPMIATSAGLLLQQLLVQSLRKRAIGLHEACIATFLLYVAWSNLHTGFMLGLISFAITLIGDWIEQRLRKDSQSADRPAALSPIQVCPLIVAAAIGSIFTPYGVSLHVYIASLATESALNTRIDELSRPDFSLMQFRLFVALVGILVVALLRRPRAVRPTDLLQVLTFIVATLFAARFVVWAALYLVLILPEAAIRAWPRLASSCSLPSPRPLICAIALTTFVVPPLLVIRGIADPVGPLCKRVLPAIHAYLVARATDDRLLTDPVTGSCMIAAAPRVPVFIDTRFDFYGGAFSTETLDALALKPGWQKFLDSHKIDVAILDRSRPLAEALALDWKFALLYRDNQAVVVRRLP
jgi:hypothetical protein